MLLTITGVGLISAAATWAILEDPHRFLRAKQVARYAGLDPSIVQSGIAAGTEALEIHGIGEEDPIELRRSWRFDLDRYLAWLERLTPWWKRCLFITAPDVWGNAEESLAFGLIAIPELKMLPFPVALPVQDGAEDLDLPRGVFLGSSGIFGDPRKRSHDLEEEVAVVAVAVAHSFEDFDLVVDAFQEAGV